MRIVDLCSMATDKTRQVPETELKETSFIWIEPARDDVLKSSAVDPLVSAIRVPGYIWPKAGDLGKSDDTALVGLFVHGGGYMMGNGSETFPECGMPFVVPFGFFFPRYLHTTHHISVTDIARKIAKVLIRLFILKCHCYNPYALATSRLQR